MLSPRDAVSQEDAEPGAVSVCRWGRGWEREGPKSPSSGGASEEITPNQKKNKKQQYLRIIRHTGVDTQETG